MTNYHVVQNGTVELYDPENPKQLLTSVKFAVHRGTRRTLSRMSGLYNSIQDVMTEDQKKEYIADDLQDYCRMVVFGHYTGFFLTNMGRKWEMPTWEALPEEHLNAFEDFLDTDPYMTEDILGHIVRINRPTAPPHMLPRNMQSEAQKTDPNLTDSGNETS